MNDSDQYKLLASIKSPDDVKKLENSELNELCKEIRAKLIDSVSSSGGHLASNLGTVEMTVAIHRIFNAPDDKIIWDVSHQAYTHKLLTGRYDSFDTLRSENGISGFVRPDESEYDSFYEGHAGTSVSQAAGIAASNRLKGNKNYAVAVIGDGSFGNGMVYEAMNSAGSAKDRVIIILNDNEMSISPNVGAMARHLAVVRAKPEYYRFKARTEKALNHIPFIGKYLSNFIFKLKTDVKSMIYKSSFFEDIGFRYIGPIDGHDIDTLCKAMNSAKMVNGPVVIHINTIKGKGYEFAEQSPEIYHGVSEFNADKGMQESISTDYSHQFGSILCDFAEKDKRICAVTAAMSLGTGLNCFFERYPSRAYDVGIAEEHAVTFCSGLAVGGMIPVFAVYSTFLQRCTDQLIHDGALQRRKMIVCVDRAGFVSGDGETHQGIYDVSIMQCIPNTVIYSPATYKDLSRAMYNALYKDDNLIVIRYPKGSMPAEYELLSNGEDFEIYGEDNFQITAVTYGREFFEVYKASEMLEKKGIHIRIIKLNKIKPIDDGAYTAALTSKKLYFFEEGTVGGGIGERFISCLSEKGYKGNFTDIGVNDEFVRQAEIDSLLKKFKLDAFSAADLIEREASNG